MAENKDILRFLVGNESALTGNPVKRGQVYFTIDPTNPGYGNIYFDAPINASTTSRLLMGLNAKFAERATRAEQDIQQNKIDTTYISDLRLNNTGFKLEFKKPGESNWHTLPAFNFLPLTGGSVTGELYAESLTADTLLVRGNSTFIEQIRGNIDTADKWKTPIKIRVNDYGNAGVGAWRNIDGSADVTLNLPNEINATAFHGLADTAKKVEHAYKLKLNGTAQTAFDGSADVEINITPSSIGALSSGGTAIAAKKLDHNVTFQIQDYSAVHTVTPGTSSNLSSTDPIVLQLPSEIDGTVQYTKYVKSILHKSSNSTVTNNYTKFASIDISSAAQVDADCLLLVQNAEGEQPNGLLRIKARRGSTVSDATIKLQWLVLSQKAAADAVSLVKTANGKYDVYWKNYGGYQDMCFAVIKSSSSLVIIPATNISVASITPAQTSVLLGYVSNAVEAEQAVKLTTSAGSNIKPVYFSGGKPVAIDSLPWGTISNRPTIVAKSSGNPIALDAAGTTFTVYLDNGTATATSYTLAPKFLPLTGGVVTGELNADSINAGSLLVNGQARFVEQIDGTVTAAIKFANPIKLRIDDATSAHSGQDSSNIYGNETSPIVLKLPSTITAEIVGHASKDLALTGGTMTGQIKQAGRSSSWVKGRETAMIRMNAVNGYSAFASIKTDEGSWEIGAYSSSDYKNRLVFAYATDEDFTNNNNTTQNITFNSNRTITAAGFKGNADSATKWQTGRKLLVHLESPQSTGATVDGSQDVGLPVTGTLGTQNGGTGNTTFTASKLIYSETATKLSSADRFTVDATNGIIAIKQQNSSSGQVRIYNNSNTLKMFIGIGSGNTNYGLYSQDLSKWMIYSDGSNVYVNGNAETATKWQTKTYVVTDLATIDSGSGLGIDGSESTTDVKHIGITGTLGVKNGGTGLSSYTANRMLYSSGQYATGNAHYVDSTKLGVNKTTAPSYNFFVEGTSFFNGKTFVNSTSNTTPFTITRNTVTTNEIASHGIDDNTYYVTYKNDENVSKIRFQLINTDEKQPHDPLQTTDFSFYMESNGAFTPNADNTGSIGSTAKKWNKVYATQFVGTADRAKADANGSTFTSTYISQLQLDSTKTKLQYKKPDNTNWSELVFSFLPLSGGTITGNLTVNGTATFTNDIQGNAQTATKWKTPTQLLVNLATNDGSGTSIDGSEDSSSIKQIGITGTLKVANGGTGKTSWTQGKLIYSSAANTLSNTGSIYSDGSRLGVGVAVDTNYKLNTDGAIYTSSYLQVGRMFYNVVNGTLHNTSKEILIKTKIPFTNSNAMPKVSIHIRNYDQAIPEDIELVWYVWNNAFHSVGATAKSSNRPYITLSKWNDGTKDYAAIGLGLIGTQVYSVYFPAVTVDFSDLWNSETRSYATGWSIEFNTSDSTSIIPESGRVNVPYKDQSNTALKWATARTFQIQDSNGGSGGATTNVDGSNNVVLKLASTIAANISGNATSANKVNKKFTLTLGSTAQTGFDGSSPVNITITPASIGALASGGTAVAANKWQTQRSFYVADHDGHQGAAVSVDGSKQSYTLKLPQNLDSNVETVDNYHIKDNVGFQFKDQKALEYTPTIDGVCYLKLTCPTTYLGSHHKFYIVPDYNNIRGCTEITVFSRNKRAYISTTNYNGCNLTGFCIPTANNDTYYLKCKTYAKVQVSVAVYANTQITNLELINSTHADYATISGQSYIAIVAGAINENQLYASLNPDSAGNRDIGTSSNKWKNVYANTFNGNLSGNATTANDALRAESDKSGNNIKNTYVSDILVKNTSVTNASGTYTYPSLYRRRGNDSSTDTLISSFAPVDADGKIALKYIPFSAIERLKIVTNAAARKALTTADVQNGDVVKQTDNNQLYLVTDDTKLNSDDGYTTFSAGTAASVNWSGVNNRPHVVGHASSQTPITLDAAGTKFTVNIVTNNNGTSSYTLSPKFLPLTGGTVTGELVADSITTGSLLVNGAARFVQTIDGNIKTANKWAAPITLTVNQTGEGTANIDGSQSVTVGVTGVLPIGHGGTGASTADNARTNLSALGAKTANGYTGMTTPSGDDTAWIRTTTQGILPYQSGNSSNGHGSLGTSSWYFLHAYIQNIHGSLDGNATSANKWATARNFITNLGSETQASVDGSSTSLYNLGVTGTLPMNHGGTGVTSLTANRLLYITSSKFAASGHYISSDKVAINSTSVPNHNLHVNGSTKLSRNIIRNGFYNDSDTAQSGDVVLTALGYKTGYPLCTIDPTFMVGMGGIEKYNNEASSSTLTVNRVTYSSAGIVSPGTGSNYVIQITSTSNSTSDVRPGLGGFVQNYTSKANATYVQIFRALIPKGYNVDAHANSQGSGSKDEWLTDTSGTGKWEWYARRVICGKDGTFSNGGHIQITGGAVPITWYLSYCQCYDVTRADYDGLKVRLADQWTTSRNFSIASNGGGGTGPTTAVNGTSNIVLQLPATITATLVGTQSRANLLNSLDLRSTNENPSWYFTNASQSVKSEFKNSSTIGITGAPAYSQVLTMTIWGDNSGGYPVQLATNTTGLWYRAGTSNTAWGAWRVIPGLDGRVTTASYPIVSTTTGNVYTHNTKITMNASNGNTSIGGTLAVTGATALSSTLAVTGTASFSSTGVNTMAGTFHNTNTTDSAHSKAQAALWVDGGASIAKQLSAKSVRVDNGQSSRGCTVKFNETYNYVEFTFD